MESKISPKAREIDLNGFYNTFYKMLDMFNSYYDRNAKGIFETPGLKTGIKVIYDTGLEKFYNSLKTLNNNTEFQDALKELKNRDINVEADLKKVNCVLDAIVEDKFMDMASRELNSNFNKHKGRIIDYIGIAKIELSSLYFSLFNKDIDLESGPYRFSFIKPNDILEGMAGGESVVTGESPMDKKQPRSEHELRGQLLEDITNKTQLHSDYILLENAINEIIPNINPKNINKQEGGGEK